MTPATHGNHKGVALVIGSGGVKCAAALGMWQVLRDAGIEVSVAVGCSGGSIYASVIALGTPLDEAVDLTRNLWTVDIMKGYADNLRLAQSGAVLFTERSGLVDDGPLMRGLETAFGSKTFHDVQVPLYLLATDFYNGERVVLSSGRLLDAVRASLAIPTIFAPHEVDGRLLVDGAAADPLPVDVAIKEGGQVIIAMGFDLDYRGRMNSLTSVNSQLNAIYTNNLLRAQFAFHNLAHHDEILMVLPEFERPISMFDTHEIPYIIEQGKRATAENLPHIKRALGI